MNWRVIVGNLMYWVLWVAILALSVRYNGWLPTGLLIGGLWAFIGYMELAFWLKTRGRESRREDDA